MLSDWFYGLFSNDLAIDLGTSNVKAAVVGRDGEVRGTGAAAIETRLGHDLAVVRGPEDAGRGGQLLLAEEAGLALADLEPSAIPRLRLAARGLGALGLAALALAGAAALDAWLRRLRVRFPSATPVDCRVQNAECRIGWVCLSLHSAICNLRVLGVRCQLELQNFRFLTPDTK